MTNIVLQPMNFWRVEICDWMSPLLPTTTTTDKLGCRRPAIRQVTFHFLTFYYTSSLFGQLFHRSLSMCRTVKSSHKPSNFHVYGSNFWFTFDCDCISWPIRGRSTLYFFHPMMAFTFFTFTGFTLQLALIFYLSVRYLLNLRLT